MQRLFLWCGCVLALAVTNSGCFLVKMIKDRSYSRRDRFAKVMVSGPKGLSKVQKQALVGKPDAGNSSETLALPLEPKSVLIAEIDFPKYNGYCESLSIYIPEKWAHEGNYRLSVSGSPKGPWNPVAVGSKSQAFDIDGTPMAVARFVRVEVLKTSRTKLWLDALRIRVHTKTWKPPMFIKLKPANAREKKRQEKQFLQLWQQGKQDFEQKRFGEARANLRGALVYRSNHAPVLFLLGATYYAMERWYQAIRHYKRGFKVGHGRREHYEEVADSFLSLKAPELARPYVNRCIAEDPLYPTCYYKRLHLASLTKNRLALAFYREVYKIVKSRANITQRGLTLQQFLQKFFGGEAPLIAKYPTYFTCLQHLAWVDFLLRLFPQETKAIVLFSQSGLESRLEALRTAPKKREGQFYWATFLHRTQQTKRSLRVLRKLEAQETRPLWLRRAFLLHGKIWEGLGKGKKAQAVYRRALQRLKSSPHSRPFFLKTTGKQLSSVLSDSK
ncbi:MAG: tetratricopeptide repeat protein [Deltaproteobacteria bacterium]|nr:MAG: tetratricopeptide repeat protein [Deltaproteobacteria bacterium]